MSRFIRELGEVGSKTRNKNHTHKYHTPFGEINLGAKLKRWLKRVRQKENGRGGKTLISRSEIKCAIFRVFSINSTRIVTKAKKPKRMMVVALFPHFIVTVLPDKRWEGSGTFSGVALIKGFFAISRNPSRFRSDRFEGHFVRE